MRMGIKPILAGFCALLLLGCAQAPSSTVERAEAPVEREDPYRDRLVPALNEALVAGEAGEGLLFRGPTEYVYLSDFQFDPATIRLKSGTVTRIRLENIAWVTHYFGGEAFFERGAEIVNILGQGFGAVASDLSVSFADTEGVVK